MVLEVRSFAIGHHPKQNPCHIPYTVSRVAISLSNSMTESDNSITLGLNAVYLSEWSCTVYPSKQVGRKGAPTPDSNVNLSRKCTVYQSKQVGPKNVTYGSKSHRFDIAGGVVHSSGEILVLSVRDVKMGLGSWNY